MKDPDAAARAETLAKLAASRDEVRRVFEPPAGRGAAAGGAGPGRGAYTGGFPRSRTMKMLMSSRGLGTVGAVAAGLLVARPALALRLLRILPAGAVAKTLLLRAITAMRSKQGPPG